MESRCVIRSIEETCVIDEIEQNKGIFVLNFDFKDVQCNQFFRKDLLNIASEFDNQLDFGEVRLELTSQLISEFLVKSVPTILLFHESAEIERIEKYWAPKILVQYLESVSSFYGSNDAGNNDAGNNDAGNNDAGNNDAGNNRLG